MGTSAQEPGGASSELIRGMLSFCLGAAVIIVTYALRSQDANALQRYGSLALIFAGAYLVVVGVERMARGSRIRRGTSDPAARRASARALAACASAVVIALGAGYAVYAWRAPYWGAVRAVASGDEAAGKLRTIAERHVALMQSGAQGADALRSWRESARQALPLRPILSASVEAARYLAGAERGAGRARAENDVRFFGLCVEWMDLFARVEREMSEQSMTEPPPGWSRAQEDIVERIQALPAPPDQGS